MLQRTKKTGFSITEVIVSMSIIAILAGIGLPAIKQVVKSFESASRLQDVVSAAMSNARAMAQARGQYIGLRFQCNAGGDQYMVFIEQDDTVWADGFKALAGRNPVRLPKRGLVMDMHLRAAVGDPTDPSYVDIINDLQIDSPQEVTDASTFCVIFSPEGKLVMHDVRIWQGAGDVFNIQAQVDAGNGKLYIDDDPANGLGEETSRNHFIIVDKNKFNSLPAGQRYSRYLQSLNVNAIYINPYTGELISN